MIITNTVVKQKKGLHDANPLIFLAIFLVTIVAFIFLQPKVSSAIFPQKRSVLLQDFLTTTKNANGIDPQSYWEFRNFYSPGYFDYSRDGLGGYLASSAIKQVGIPINESLIDRIFLIYHSQYLHSIDLPTSANSLEQIIPGAYFNQAETLFKGKNIIITRQSDGSIIIAFLKNETEMKRANGFMFYLDNDKRFKNKNWLNMTRITSDKKIATP